MNEIEVLVEKDKIVDTLTELFMAADCRDWAAVKDVFTPEVHFDRSSLSGTPATVPAAQIAAGWEEGSRPIKAVHHQAGNFQTRIDGNKAGARCYRRISLFRFNLEYVDGNLELAS